MERMHVLRLIAKRLKKVFPVGRPGVFEINLSSRHRAYVAPLRWVLIATCGLLVVTILWEAAQAFIGYQEVSRISRELERVRQDDDALLAEVSRDGVDLSEGSLQLLPSEVAFANQLLAKRMFSWTKFLTALEQAFHRA